MKLFPSKSLFMLCSKLVVVTLISALFATGCQVSSVELESKVKPVEVMMLKNEARASKVRYFGYVIPDYIKKYSFSTGGTLEPIALKPGDQVKVGDLLASIKPDKLNIAVNTANQQLASAQLQVQKAQSALDFIQKAVTDAKPLLESGGVTAQQFDELVLKRDMAKKDLELANGQVSQAQLQGQYQRKNRSDATLSADVDGVVAQILFEAGELVGPGYPVVIVKSLGQVISVSMTAEDMDAIDLGEMAKASNDSQTWDVKLIEKSVLPDEKTRTYELKFAISGKVPPYVGELLAVDIAKSSVEGIWLPINAILNDGVDYVYVVESGRAIRKNIVLKTRVDDEVSVEGLAVDDQLITKGSTSVSHGYQVNIVEGGQ